MTYYTRTEIGNIRENNEDSFLTKELNGALLLLICDGMGGHNSGEVASQMAVKLTDEWNFEFKNAKPSDIKKAIKRLVEDINIKIYLKSKSSDKLSGMGTTFSMVIIYDNYLYYAHVGDSRIYICDKKLKQITTDHTIMEEMRKKGIEIEDDSKYVGYITRAVGSSSIVVADIDKMKLKDTSSVLLCSDGITKYIFDHELEEIILKGMEEKETVDRLVELSLERGGRDNITCIFAKIGE
ncbi:MAG: protein phosphatase 2C domain-containing protein [Ezakiella sp.]|nr:protein phosphatase 2C domain-containing protein [Ezakiella sp.]